MTDLQRTGMVVLAVVLALSVAAARGRNAVYHDDLALWSLAVEQTPGKARPHFILGRALIDAGRPAEALREMETAVSLAATSTTPSEQLYSGLAVALLATGRIDAASEAAMRALSYNPASRHALNAVGEALFAKGSFGEAAHYFERAVLQAPGDPAALWNAAAALEKAGKDQEARQYALRFLDEAVDERSRGDARALLDHLEQKSAKRTVP